MGLPDVDGVDVVAPLGVTPTSPVLAEGVEGWPAVELPAKRNIPGLVLAYSSPRSRPPKRPAIARLSSGMPVPLEQLAELDQVEGLVRRRATALPPFQ